MKMTTLAGAALAVAVLIFGVSLYVIGRPLDHEGGRSATVTVIRVSSSDGYHVQPMTLEEVNNLSSGLASTVPLAKTAGSSGATIPAEEWKAIREYLENRGATSSLYYIEIDGMTYRLMAATL